MWRKPFSEQTGFWKSKLTIITSKKFAGSKLKLNPENFKYINLQQFWRKKKLEKKVYEQKFDYNRLYILGSELGAAHFTVFRGGAVKFHNHSSWIRDDKTKNREYDDNLPNSYDSNYILEAIDFSDTEIVYEGLKNIENLKMCKWLSFTFCPYFDNWCLDRISGEFGEKLEYLDISYTDVSHHGLSVLYRCKNLKTLKVHGISDNSEFVLTCQKLQQAFPELTIEGISEETVPREMLGASK